MGADRAPDVLKTFRERGIGGEVFHPCGNRHHPGDAGSLGASGKYHETITYAFMFLIHERVRRGGAETFDAFASANADLFGPILQRYYRPETLASELARASFVMPDHFFV